MNIASELNKILTDERNYLLEGNFEALEKIIDKKSKLVEWLSSNETNLPREIITALRSQATHNEALLVASQNGVKAALVVLKRTSDTIDQSTYSANGTRKRMISSTSSIMQKI